MQYLPSALSQGSQHVLFCATNDCCPLVSRPLPVSLSNVLLLFGRRLRPSVAVVSGRRFRPEFRRVKFGIFILAVFLLRSCPSGFTFGDNVTFAGTSFSRLCRNRHTAFSALLRTCSFLSHPSLCMAQGGKFCSLVHVEFCVKTLHLSTVSLCLAWSSLLPRYVLLC